MPRITVDLVADASLTVEQDGRIHIFWRDGRAQHYETYPDLSTALIRIAVLDHIAVHNKYCVHHLPEHFIDHAQDYLYEETRSRSARYRPWARALGPARTIVNRIDRIRR